jgi:phenylacetate-CoA ligase
LGDLPITRKSELMHQFGDWVPDPRLRMEDLRRFTADRLMQRLLDPWYLGERIVFVGATSGHFASTVSAERLRRALIHVNASRARRPRVIPSIELGWWNA